MIVSRISDGFGNQLFMYAIGYAMAKQLNAKLILDLSYIDNNNIRKYELDKLNVAYDRVFTTSSINFYPFRVFYRRIVHGIMRVVLKKFKENKDDYYIYNSRIELLKDGIYLDGYWQNEKYFRRYKSELMSMITPKYNPPQGYMHYKNDINRSESVAIHIRRGDYEALGICLGKDYYTEAIEYVSRQLSNPKFYVFSDNIEFAKELLGKRQEDIVFVRYQSDNPTLDDFFLMKECKHMIMANSSFSWWAAWLKSNTDRIIVRPKSDGTFKDEFYPSEWIEK